MCNTILRYNVTVVHDKTALSLQTSSHRMIEQFVVIVIWSFIKAVLYLKNLNLIKKMGLLPPTTQ